MLTAAFIFCAGIIPVVPLVGINIFHRRKDNVRKNVCIGLFVLQLLLSLLYVLSWLRTH